MFINIKRAVKILKDQNRDEDEVGLSLHVIEGEITGYIKTPLLPSCDDDVSGVFRCAVESFFDQRLASYCKIVDPVWEDEKITFTTIIVTDAKGKPPTSKNPYYTLSEHDGQVGPGGRFFLRQGWKCNETELRFDKSELTGYAANKKDNDKKNRILCNLYQQAEVIWEAVKAEKKKTPLSGRLIEVALAERNKRKFPKIKRIFFENEVLKTRLAQGKKPKRDFIGTLLQLALLEEGINADSYVDIYEEAIKLVNVP